MDSAADQLRAAKALTLPLNGVYFDQIARGEKLEEYRLCNAFWSNRLMFKNFDTIVLTRGYPKGGGIEGQTRLTRKWRGYQVRTITHPHFGSDPVEVFAIDVSTAIAAQSPEPTP